MRDEFGSQVIFHGVNVIFKEKPYLPQLDEFHPQESLTIGDIKNLKQLGFNFVRLGVPWEAVEVEPEVYNQTYLNEVELVVSRLADEGIYTMIDSH